MRPALARALALAVGAAACGQPEDLLVIEGRVRGVGRLSDGRGQQLRLLRDVGATDFGCTGLQPWRTLEAADGGYFRIEALRQELSGRGIPYRCLRLEWSEGERGRTASLSWVAQPRGTLLPDLLTWFDAPDAWPSFPLEGGSLLPPQLSAEARDARGVVFRQAATPELTLPLTGPGFEPAHGSELVSRLTQRGQLRQRASFGGDPLIAFEYRIESWPVRFSGEPSFRELAYGSACTVPAPGSGGCALTDGLFSPVEVLGRSVELTLARPAPVSKVVLRGIGSEKPFSAVVVDAQTGAFGSAWVSPLRAALSSTNEMLATTTVQDPVPVLYLVVHRALSLEPVTRLRVRLEDDQGLPVPMSWLAEVSVY